jgi:hypothetical protein
MLVQERNKGIHGIRRDQAEDMLRLEGPTCNRWRQRSNPGIKPIEAAERLTSPHFGDRDNA